jgi:pyruvate dehydrogenase kinase 2/3/4
VAGFLRHELPIRLAHRIEDLDNVPMMRDMPSVQTVKATYINSLLELVDFEEHISSPALEAEFSVLLQGLYQNHADVLLQMAHGAYELHQRLRQGKKIEGHLPSDSCVFSELESCHEFLDRFYMSRVGIRTLAGQYLALREQKLSMLEGREGGHGGPPLSGRQRYIGMICLDTSPLEIVQTAAEHATDLCMQNYGQAPEVIIEGRIDLTFPYFPTHLHYMLLELLKNACRATMEHHEKSEAVRRPKGFSFYTMDSDPPPVRVIIADGTENEDVVIKISDQGGGIRRSVVDKIWSYLFTTASPEVQASVIGEQEKPKFNASAPIAGLGVGLPLSRAYARYFGGDLDVISMEGYGTDAFLHLARLGEKQQLPM